MSDEYEKKPYIKDKDDGSPVIYESELDQPEKKLKRQLKNRHIAMISYVV